MVSGTEVSPVDCGLPSDTLSSLWKVLSEFLQADSLAVGFLTTPLCGKTSSCALTQEPRLLRNHLCWMHCILARANRKARNGVVHCYPEQIQVRIQVFPTHLPCHLNLVMLGEFFPENWGYPGQSNWRLRLQKRHSHFAVPPLILVPVAETQTKGMVNHREDLTCFLC